MAITGIDTIEGKQIIAAGAVSAKSAEMAYNDENGNPITGYQVAGDYYSASNPSGFITGVDLTPYQTVEGMTAYQPVGNYQTAGDYLTTADSANFYTTANESGFITGVDLTPYQLTADMTAYQSAGDYLTTADSANFYTTANESGFITGVPDTYLQNTDLTIADNKVTEISGIPLSAGTELEFEYDIADNISAINHSAISTTPAQALYAKSPLYFDVTGTSSYMGINSADLARMLGVDETVLFETTASPTAEANLSESWKNFDHLKICVQNLSNDNGWTYVEVKPLDREGYTQYYNIVAGFSYGLGTNGMIWQNIIGTASDTKLTNCSSFGFQNSWTATSVTIRKNNLNDINCIRKVIGVGRKENV